MKCVPENDKHKKHFISITEKDFILAVELLKTESCEKDAPDDQEHNLMNRNEVDEQVTLSSFSAGRHGHMYRHRHTYAHAHTPITRSKSGVQH